MCIRDRSAEGAPGLGTHAGVFELRPRSGNAGSHGAQKPLRGSQGREHLRRTEHLHPARTCLLYTSAMRLYWRTTSSPVREQTVPGGITPCTCLLYTSSKFASENTFAIVPLRVFQQSLCSLILLHRRHHRKTLLQGHRRCV